MKLASTGLAHIGLRVTDLARARHFYADILGFEPLLELPDLLICNAYGSTIAFRGNATQTHADDRFDPYRVGLDHVALGVPSANELEEMKRHLDLAGVPNNGVEQETMMPISYISFYDPDGIAWELYEISKQ
ncbi:glyoxalase [Dictyobacter alpinus]|uniref:Glyoxalase n=1 Tax=Dictyobacter alpinus TaxID=2014873 RepID=A0A402BE30_9CHLR|nr:VOC family protein [Dictyobacter alpinus]GCE29615.1 glyoxalase [Dictyobacter alpinus]